MEVDISCCDGYIEFTNCVFNLVNKLGCETPIIILNVYMVNYRGG